MKRTLSLLVFVAACGPKAASTTDVGNGGGAPAGFAPAKEYAALFQPNAMWTFATENTDDHWDDQDPAADANGNVHATTAGEASCTVTAVTPFDGGVMSQIDCGDLGGEMGFDPLTGTWVANAAGLYRFAGEQATAVPDLKGQTPVLDAVPKTYAHEDQGNEEDGEGSSSTEVTHDGEAWCWSYAMSMGDDSWTSFCLDGAGPTSGDFGWGGGSVHEVKFTRK